MVKATQKIREIRTVDQMVTAYGGEAKTIKAFGLAVEALADWRKHGTIPRGHELGAFLGLQARGYSASPRLFGVRGWGGLPGVGRRWP